MPADDISFAKDILEAAKDAVDFVSNLSRLEFEEDIRTQAAVIQRLTVIGEAVKRLSQGIQERYPDIPWSKMARMGDLLVHYYHRINFSEVWDTLKNDLPTLIENIKSFLGED
ncbi:MAG: DUF86 domain-containing protein [bacterium]|nr:DUF86 domain-containing protein [bacterium]